MLLDRPLEGLDDHVGALGVIDPVSDHVSRAVVDEDEGEGRAAIDVAVNEVQMPQVVWSHSLEPLVVGLRSTFGGR